MRQADRAVVNSIVGVHDYRCSDGGTMAIDNSFDRVFQDAAGNYVATRDPSYDPRQDPELSGRNWSELQRVNHFRRGR